MKSLKAYATTGDRIILDVTLNGGSMGSRVPFDRERRIEGRVIGTAPIESVTIVRNDQTVWSQDYLTLADNQLKSEETRAMKDLSFREFAIFAPLVAVVFWMGIYPVSFLDVMSVSVNNLIENYEASLAAAGAGDGVIASALQ